MEGLYRVPGFADDITYLRNQIDKGWFYIIYFLCYVFLKFNSVFSKYAVNVVFSLNCLMFM